MWAIAENSQLDEAEKRDADRNATIWKFLFLVCDSMTLIPALINRPTRARFGSDHKFHRWRFDLNGFWPYGSLEDAHAADGS